MQNVRKKALCLLSAFTFIPFRCQMWWMVTRQWHQWQIWKTPAVAQAPLLHGLGPDPSSKPPTDHRTQRRPPLPTERPRQNTNRVKNKQRRESRPSLSWRGCSFKEIREWRLWLRSSSMSSLRYFSSICGLLLWMWTDIAAHTRLHHL